MATKQSTSIPNATVSPTNLTDAVEHLRACSQAFGQVGAILAVIKERLDETSDVYRLAGAASHITADYENVADWWSGGADDLVAQIDPRIA